ncbi:hypothetical protein SARC_03650 [Sphaeroforma arctica JP610]|uniref:DUF659 domain-containing protein n=1 Tax=Sphaeroforma arctica JP610 TaxID=667725 RepID=A0A0L0G5D6_9EUKA|nr:hypothetical protein SARC_03650 [Sphaeroforma arctica JP610]KNC84129.1 hypothetical protein SARC_03650 [Sphaeroforma arctica JP610]|eukprot:XP_014158031.1 hypothetical protein SARC_03650 [Sphaeroforma arctica JP610]
MYCIRGIKHSSGTLAFDGASIHKKPVLGVAVMSPGLKKAISAGVYNLSAVKAAGESIGTQVQCDLLRMVLDSLPHLNSIEIVVYSTGTASECLEPAVTMKQRRPYINYCPDLAHVVNIMFKDLCSIIEEIKEWLNKVDIICKYFNSSHFMTTYLAKLTARMNDGRSLDQSIRISRH